MSWTLVQSASSAAIGSGATAAPITVSATGAGHVLVAAILTQDTAANPIASVSGGGTWSLVTASGCNSWNGNNRNVDIAYCLASTSGATTITVNRTSAIGGTWFAVVAEYSFTSGSVSLDTFGIKSQASGANPTGPDLTLTGLSDLIVQVARSGVAITAVSSPFTIEQQPSTNSPFADSLNTSSGTGPTWTMTTSGAALSAIAIKEVAAGGACFLNNLGRPGVHNPSTIETGCMAG